MSPWPLPCHVTLQGKQHFLGYFKEEDDAAATYDAAAMMFMGNHQLNFPDKVGQAAQYIGDTIYIAKAIVQDSCGWTPISSCPQDRVGHGQL